MVKVKFILTKLTDFHEPQEISRSSEVARRAYPGKQVVFRTIAVKEPIRSEVTQ